MRRNFNIDSAVSYGATHTGTAVGVDKAYQGFALQVVLSSSSSIVGNLKVQASIDTSDLPVNWGDIADTVTALTADGTTIFNFDVGKHFRWVRLVFTRTSGSATATTTFNENY